MKSIRLVLVLFAILLVAGVGALVARALQSVETERSMRHEIIARRVFDELERSLTDLVAREEERSFLEYRYFYVPSDSIPGQPGLSLSPLASGPTEDFVLGYFQVEPDGTLGNPRRPRDLSLAVSTTAWAETDELLAYERELERLTRELRGPLQRRWQQRQDEQDERRETELASLDGVLDAELVVGTERVSDGGWKGKDPAPAPAEKLKVSSVAKEERKGTAVSKSDGKAQAPGKKQEAPRKQSNSDYLDLLNTGAKRRSGRQAKSVELPSDNAGYFQLGNEIEAESSAEAVAGMGTSTGQRQSSRGELLVQKEAAQVADRNLPVVAAPDAAAAIADSLDGEAEAGEAEESAGALGASLEQDGLASLDEEAAADDGSEDGVDAEHASQRDEVQSVQVTEARKSGSRRRPRPFGKPRRRGGMNKASAPPAADQQIDEELLRREEAEGFEAVLERQDPLVDAAAAAPPDPVPEIQAKADEAMEEPAQASTGSAGRDGGPEAAADARESAHAPDERAPGPPPKSQPVAVAPPTPTPWPTPQPTPPPAPRVEPTVAPVRPPPPDLLANLASGANAEVSPLRGRRIDEEHLLLHREVVLGDLTYLQGFVLLLPALTRSLQADVFELSELADLIELRWSAGDADPRGDFAYAFRHDFEEPFAGLGTTALVRPLAHDGQDPRALVLLLAVLLGVVGLLGFAALYRMVAVVVHFAERRNNFVAAVSHELKTPLTAIRMYGEILRDDLVPTDEKRREYYGTITAESERLSRLIDNVLTLSRLEKGSRTVQTTVGSLAPVLAEVLRVLSPHARLKGFELRLEADPDLPPVAFDRDALTQVLINLVDNALKFSGTSDEKVVVLEARRKDGEVLLRVRDHGPGVPAVHLRRIFQPFFRGERELTRSTKGTGIGLALVRGLVEQMGGRVAARNHPGGGFEVTIGLVPG